MSRLYAIHLIGPDGNYRPYAGLHASGTSLASAIQRAMEIESQVGRTARVVQDWSPLPDVTYPVTVWQGQEIRWQTALMLDK